jgi:hypothetical protein
MRSAADIALLVLTAAIALAALSDGRLLAGGFLLVIAAVNFAYLLRRSRNARL